MVEAVPLQAANVGDPPFVETRHKVPAPPVEVCNIFPLLSAYKIPFAFVSELALKDPATLSSVAGVEVPIPMLDPEINRTDCGLTEAAVD